MPPSFLAVYGSFDNAVYAKIYAAAFYIPPAIFIVGISCITKIYHAVLYIPPAVYIVRYGCNFCCNLAIFIVVPFVSIYCYICKTICMFGDKVFYCIIDGFCHCIYSCLLVDLLVIYDCIFCVVDCFDTLICVVAHVFRNRFQSCFYCCVICRFVFQSCNRIVDIFCHTIYGCLLCDIFVANNCCDSCIYG